MRFETRQVRIGERIGDIDWSYDFESHGWDREGHTNPSSVRDAIKRLRELADGLARGEEWEATTDGGWPRCGWGKVLSIGMYDGWPYWTPVPSVMLSSWTGGASWHSFLMLTDARKVG